MRTSLWLRYRMYVMYTVKLRWHLVRVKISKKRDILKLGINERTQIIWQLTLLVGEKFILKKRFWELKKICVLILNRLHLQKSMYLRMYISAVVSTISINTYIICRFVLCSFNFVSIIVQYYNKSWFIYILLE